MNRLKNILILIGIFTAQNAFSGGHHKVRGYVTKKGQFISPHNQTNRDKSKINNWSTRGNVNPYTGKPGKKKLK